MNPEAHQKVRPEHLQRRAFLYVRQSSMQQVRKNLESTKRQYGLRDRALALGWSSDQITVIDCDQGQSGRSAARREGFQQLVTGVSMNRAGIVMGLEVSRLARNCSDWHRLLEICALTQTLLLDEDAVYDPSHFNDRLLLGLKGTMSEAELHVIRARLRGGLLQKARRGELGGRLASGLVYGTEGRVELDPDQQVQASFRHLFATFERTGSALAVVKAFAQAGLKFPRRVWGGSQQGELVWDDLVYHRVKWILNCPRYAGAYCFGRSRFSPLPSGLAQRTKKQLPPEAWHAFIPNAHAGYLNWEQFQGNQQRLAENATQYRCPGQRTPPREGPALLQGIILCGKCGSRMGVRYHQRRGQLYPDYECKLAANRYGHKPCQCIPGWGIDRAISGLLLDTVKPLNLEVALTVQHELQSRLEEVDRLRRQTVQRARHEAELARRRFLQVDPDHRLVADQLEADWNQKLRALRQVEEAYEKQREADRQSFTAEQRQKILALAAEFPKVWNDPALADRDRKRMVRLLIEDVTLHKGDRVLVQVRFKGGARRTLEVPLPLPFYALCRTNPEVIEAIDRLLGTHPYEEIAELLNARGFRSGQGRAFNPSSVGRLCEASGLKSRRERLREAGLLTRSELAHQLKVAPWSITRWRQAGRITGHRSNYKMEVLYEPLSTDVIARLKSQKRHEKTT